MRLTAILLGLIVLMATALDIYADFTVTSTYAGTGNKTTASQMGISFSSTNEVVWACQCSLQIQQQTMSVLRNLCVHLEHMLLNRMVNTYEN